MKSKSWQKKLPPAFNEVIRECAKAYSYKFKHVKDGYICIDDLPDICDKTDCGSFSKYYSLDNNNGIPIFSLFDNLDPDEFLNLFNIHNNEKYSEYICRLTENMDTENQKYYRKWINNIPPQAENRIFINFVSDLLALQFHYILISADKLKENDILGKTNAGDFIFSNIALLAFVKFKKPLGFIFEKAKDGDDMALFKLIKMDKTLFDLEWVRDRIRKAYYDCDKKFFESLAKAIKAAPMQVRTIKFDIQMLLMSLWLFGLYRLTMPELMELLEDSGIEIESDEVTFRRFIDREIKPAYGRLRAYK